MHNSAACARESPSAIWTLISSVRLAGIRPDELIAERPSVDVLHRDEQVPVVGADVVDRNDVRVIQRGGGAGFLLEAGAALGIGGELAEHLDHDLAAEPAIVRCVDLAHASGADRREDLVGTEAGSGGDGHGLVA